MENLGCYHCGKKILSIPFNREDSAKAQSDSLGRRVFPSPDYTCVGVCLSNGKDSVDYATPVCRECMKFLVESKVGWENLKINLLAQIKKHDFGPKHLFKNNPSFSVVTVQDLTEELRENKVI